MVQDDISMNDSLLEKSCLASVSNEPLGNGSNPHRNEFLAHNENQDTLCYDHQSSIQDNSADFVVDHQILQCDLNNDIKSCSTEINSPIRLSIRPTIYEAFTMSRLDWCRYVRV